MSSTVEALAATVKPIRAKIRVKNFFIIKTY
jgi:hypothetical protein